MSQTEPRALIIVDVQPTFCEGGELAVEGGNATANAIADYVKAHRGKYDVIASTQDYHIDPGTHFSDNPDYVDTWPAHGVAGTSNAELHPVIEALHPDLRVKKGQYAAAYSGFEGTSEDGAPLNSLLADRGIKAVDVVGIAESHCVKATALDAKANGYQTRVFTDLTVPVSKDQGQAARKKWQQPALLSPSN